ncbi:hypothetical protein ES703_51684 [subsurface metagenome]
MSYFSFNGLISLFKSAPFNESVLIVLPDSVKARGYISL